MVVGFSKRKDSFMKITVLMEDTKGNPICEHEHGLSLYVETKNHKILADTGASKKTIENAKRLGIDLSKVDKLFLSHGHYDHSGGILSFYEENNYAKLYLQESALLDYYHGDRYIGIAKEIKNLETAVCLNSDFRIDEELSIFTGIRGRRFWPKSNKILSIRKDGIDVQDEFQHEQCLVIEEEKTVLISGCAHNGILNVLDRYYEIYASYPDSVISGFHMMKKTDYTEEEIEVIQQTAKELSKLPTIFYTGHCTGQKAMEWMKEIMGQQLVPIHSGMQFS